MADFGGMVLTSLGLNLLAKAQTGAALNITRVAAGAGVWADDTNAEDVTALVDERLSVPIQSLAVQGDGTVKLTVVISNSGLDTGFIFRELGVFATDPDLGEILYAVAYSGDRYDYLPASATTVEKVLDIYIVVGGAQNVTATISPGAVLALKSDIEEHEAADPAHPASKISFDNAAAGLEGDPTRVQAALEALSARTLEPLAVSRQLYVATTGSDTDNDGLSAETPFRTIGHAIAVVALNYALGDYDITINVAAGTYAECVNLRPYSSGTGCIVIVGAGIGQTIVKDLPTTYANTLPQTIKAVTGSGEYTLTDMTISAPSVSSLGCRAVYINYGVVKFQNISFLGGGVVDDLIIKACKGSVIYLLSGCSLSAASCHAFLYADTAGEIIIVENVTINGSSSIATAYASQLGIIYRDMANTPTVSGTVTGYRYVASLNGIISTNGGGASYFPGSVAGYTATG